MKAIGNAKFCDEFLAGMRACRDGEKCPKSASEDFLRGYEARYAAEQVLTNKSMRRSSND